MTPKLFPYESAHPGIEDVYAKAGTRSNALYWTILLIMAIALAALPLIKVEVSVHTRGQITDAQINIPVLASTQGQVIWENLREEQPVVAGERLLAINGLMIQEEKAKLLVKISELQDNKSDLEKLLSAQIRDKKLATKMYRHEFNQFLHERKLSETRHQFAQQALERTRKLHEQQVISRVEYEQAVFEANVRAEELAMLEERQQKAWETELSQISREIIELSKNLSILQAKEQELEIVAPADGILFSPAGIKPGSYIFPGQQIAQISSHQALLAETYIPTSKVGLIRTGMPVKIHLDAYPSNQWGYVNGVVDQIAKEVKLIENTPVFVAKICLEEKELSLKNGYTGQIKKGMTLSGRFLLSKRSLLSLIFEKAEDWLDPRQHHALVSNN